MRKKMLGMFLAGVLAMTALTGCEGAANGNNGAGTQGQASGEEQTTGDQQTTAEPAGDGALTGTLNLGVIGQVLQLFTEMLLRMVPRSQLKRSMPSIPLSRSSLMFRTMFMIPRYQLMLTRHLRITMYRLS